MTAQRVRSFLSLMVVALFVFAAALLTYSRGRGQCPQCGYMGDLHECKHCGWTACLSCWQRMSQHNTCPSCGRYGP
jgi:hypothetical protein